jgi:hypothetical protein
MRSRGVFLPQIYLQFSVLDPGSAIEMGDEDDGEQKEGAVRNSMDSRFVSQTVSR